MRLTRRHMLAVWGGALATLAAPAVLAARQPQVIEMRGTARGERVWFSPIGIAIAAGTVLRFVNRDPGNSHTSTAYHPDVLERARRIPEAALPWNSDFLLPDETFEVTLTAPGVYDYYCIPHEMAGMVGRIVVGRPDDPGWQGPVENDDDLPEAAARAFPSVGDIMAAGRIEVNG